jgi:hypothetical protein
MSLDAVNRCRRPTVGLMAALLVLALLASPAIAEQPLSYAEERRIVLTFQVPEAALDPLLPPGWRLEPATAGIYAGANLFLVLADQTFIRDVRGRTVENTLAVVWLAPARGNATGSGLLVLGGYVEPEAAPGTYGVYRPAVLSLERSPGLEEVETGIASERWQASGDDGGTLHMTLVYDRADMRRALERTHTYSARDPAVQRLYDYDQQIIPLVSPADDTDRIHEFTLTVSGGELGRLIEGPDRLISIVGIPWTAIQAYLP